MDKLIIVDDEEWVRYFIAHGIKWRKFGLQIAGEGENGKQGLELCRTHRPAVLITDIRMPGLDGVALFRTVHRELPQTRVLVLSGYDDFEYAREAIREDVFDYLLKPVSREVLEEAVAKALRDYRESSADRREQKKVQRELHKLRQLAADSGSASGKDQAEPKEGMHAAVRKAVKIIEEEYSGTLTLEGTAERVFVSPHYLSGLFRRETGKGFNEYLTARRIVAAAALLKEDAFNINEIARMTGYEDSNYFSRVFKKKTGCSPMDFRRRNCIGEPAGGENGPVSAG